MWCESMKPRLSTRFINETGLDNGSYSSLAVKGNLIVTTGAKNQ